MRRNMSLPADSARAQTGLRAAWPAVPRLIGPACLLLAAACTAYRPAPLEPQRSVAAFAARRVDDLRVRAAVAKLLPQSATPWPPRRWNRALLLAAAWAQNRSLALARARTRAAIAAEGLAAQPPNPNLTLMSEYARQDAHPWLYGVGTAWLLRTPSRRALRVRIATLSADRTELAMMDQLWSVRSGLIRAMSDGEADRARLALLDRLVAVERRVLEMRRRRAALGEDAAAPLTAAEQVLLVARLRRDQLRTALEVDRSDLAHALGLPRQALHGLMPSWPDWGRPPPIDVRVLRAARERALLSRADLGAAIDDYAAAEARLRLAVARQHPQFVLEPGYYWDHGIGKFPLDLGFTLPLNGNRAEIATASADREVAGRRLLALQSAIYAQIDAANSTEDLARANLADARRLVENARQAETRARSARRLGESAALDTSAAAILTIEAELAELDARARLQAARDSLEDALQAPLSGPELALDVDRAAPKRAGGP